MCLLYVAGEAGRYEQQDEVTQVLGHTHKFRKRVTNAHN